MKIKWETFDKSWAHGDVLIKDFQRRIPNILADMKIKSRKKKSDKLLKWMIENILPFENSLPHSGATGIYIFTNKK